jgi:hypothetical protein
LSMGQKQRTKVRVAYDFKMLARLPKKKFRYAKKRFIHKIWNMQIVIIIGNREVRKLLGKGLEGWSTHAS